MKNKLLALLLVLVIALSALCFIVSAEDETPSLSLGGASLVMENAVNIRYAVAVEGTTPDKVEILVFSTPQNEYTKGNEDYTAQYTGNSKKHPTTNVTYYLYDFEGVSAKKIADYFYAVAHVEVNGEHYYSAPSKYSALEYAYKMTGRLDVAAQDDAELIAMLNAMLDYGASAQKYFNHNLNRLADADMYQLSLVGGLLSDGFASGIYPKGVTLEIVADAEKNGIPFYAWVDDGGSIVSRSASYEYETVAAHKKLTAVYKVEDGTIDLNDIPQFDNSQEYVKINGDLPFFTEDELTTNSYASYSELDALDRAGVAMGCLGQDLFPSTDRPSLPNPTGWHGGSIYERCHLIAHSLAGNNTLKNLITGTYDLNGVMQEFEEMVKDYIEETNNHVMYRVTPIYEGDNLVASGVVMEGWSVEDNGEGISFCIYIYNEQDDETIDHATGDVTIPERDYDFVVNKNNGKIHTADCSNVAGISDANKLTFKGSYQELLQVYKDATPGGCCHPENSDAGSHTHSYSEATCTEPAKCSCGATSGDALGHTTENGTCTGCNQQIGSTAPAEKTTVTVNIGEYAARNNWQNDNKDPYTSVAIDSNITATANGGGNTGKYYTSGNNWRFYETEKATLTISATNGKKIISVKITYKGENGGTLVFNATNIASGTVVNVNAESITFSISNNNTTKNEQVRITAIEVVYE